MESLTKKIAQMVEEFESNLKVGPDQDRPLAPAGEPFRTFLFGRVLDSVHSKLTDDELVKRMESELRRYKRNSHSGKTVYWRERPDFREDFCNTPIRNFSCRVVISERELVEA